MEVTCIICMKNNSALKQKKDRQIDAAVFVTTNLRFSFSPRSSIPHKCEKTH